ncbi:MAG TPA: D-glycerate dehydrogenase [Ignavibacteriaceae bacterium]|nr:D-glycerate dehydrogenase [Ignavibacteriaceae bacterium]
MKIFITRKIPGIAESLLNKNGFDVTSFKKDKPISKQELLKSVKGIDALISLLTDKIDKDIIDAMPGCKVIANYAVGYNNIDVNYAKSKGIVVTNTPDILTDATADLAVTLLLAAARRVIEGDNMMRQNKFEGWKPQLLTGVDVRNKTVGILGTGRIGTAFAKRMSGFDSKILYYDKTNNEQIEKRFGGKKVTLNTLLKKADFISIHLPLTPDTYHLLNKEKLQMLKSTAVVINTARGEIIEERELIKLLKGRKIFAAGFDVYENEPAVNSELFKLDNVVLLPHVGSATIETRSKMAELAAKNVIAVLKNKKPLTAV